MPEALGGRGICGGRGRKEGMKSKMNFRGGGVETMNNNQASEWSFGHRIVQ